MRQSPGSFAEFARKPSSGTLKSDPGRNADPGGHGGLRIERDRAAVHFILDRPRALNALNDHMKDELAEAIPNLARDPDIYVAILRSASPRAFCAGGDIRELTELGRRDLPAAKRSLANEYTLNWLLECFYKPSVALIDGMVMGSGVGITLYSTHRVAGDNYAFAMPETAVGLFPDVGVSCALAAMPDEVGTYLGLTGRTIGAADAYALGLITHCLPASEYDAVMSQLADAQPIDPLLDSRHQDPGPPPLERHRKDIAAAFAADTVEEIIERLRRRSAASTDVRDWLEAVIADLMARSPTSLKVTLRHLRAARGYDLRATLIADYRLGCRFLENADLYEGVRALLIDKDRQPSWKPGSLEEVTEEIVAQYFASLGDAELDLPDVEEMLASRMS